MMRHNKTVSVLLVLMFFTAGCSSYSTAILNRPYAQARQQVKKLYGGRPASAGDLVLLDLPSGDPVNLRLERLNNDPKDDDVDRWLRWSYDDWKDENVYLYRDPFRLPGRLQSDPKDDAISMYRQRGWIHDDPKDNLYRRQGYFYDNLNIEESEGTVTYAVDHYFHSATMSFNVQPAELRARTIVRLEALPNHQTRVRVSALELDFFGNLRERNQYREQRILERLWGTESVTDSHE